MQKHNEYKMYYGFSQHSRMNFCNVPNEKYIDEIVFGIYVENDGCISEAAFVWEKFGDGQTPYLRVFCDGITIAYSDNFKSLVNEIRDKDSIAPKEIVELLLRHGFKDISDKPLTV